MEAYLLYLLSMGINDLKYFILVLSSLSIDQQIKVAVRSQVVSK